MSYKTPYRYPDDADLTAADYEAADKVIAHIPQWAVENLHRYRWALAREHHRLGKSSFELFNGLRPAANAREELALAHRAGLISREECGRKRREHLEKSLDQETLDVFFAGLQEEIGVYSELVQVLLATSDGQHQVEWEIRKEVERLLAGFCRRFPFYREEIEYLHKFVAEARIARNAGLVQSGNYNAGSYATAVSLLVGSVKTAWKNRICDADDARQTLEVARFYLSNRDIFLRPMDLGAMLEHEHAITSIYLREIRAPVEESAGHPAAASKSMHADIVNIYLKDKKLTTQNETKKLNPKPVISVDNWSELVVGVDARGYWAVKGPLPFGSEFHKKTAVQLNLKGDRWKELLRLFASSADGQTVSHADVIRALGYLAPPSHLQTDGRARPREIDAATRHELPKSAGTVRRKLNSLLSDLRRELREQVACPKDRGDCLKSRGQQIVSGFPVAPLLSDGAGHLRFGDARA